MFLHIFFSTLFPLSDSNSAYNFSRRHANYAYRKYLIKHVDAQTPLEMTLSLTSPITCMSVRPLHHGWSAAVP